MKFSVGSKVSHYGELGYIVDKDPATNKYLVDFTKEDEEKITYKPVYESELTKIEDSDD